MLTTSSIYFVASYSIPKTGETTVIGRMYVVCLLNGLIVILVGIVTTSLVVIHEDDLLSHSHLLEIFRRFDKDFSDTLEIDEAKNALTELGLDEEQQHRLLLRLDPNRDGCVQREEWLQISKMLTFNPRGAKALARHHSRMTGYLIRFAMERDIHETHTLQWSKQTVKKDLLLILSEKLANLAWAFLLQLEVAGNWSELKRTRDLLQISDAHSSSMERHYIYEQGRLLEKIKFIARAVVSAALQQDRSAALQQDSNLSREISAEKFRQNSSRNFGVIGGEAHRRRMEAETQHEHEQIRQMEVLLVKVLRGRNKPMTESPSMHMRLPRSPKLVDLNEWSAEELRDFLLNVEGDMCDKAHFRKHAQRLADAEVDGACVKGFNSITAAECGVGVGDREHLVRGMKLLYRLYTQACRFRHEVKISVLSAQHLPKMDLYGSIDSYVRLDLENTKTGTVQNYITPVVEDTYDPVWKNAHGIFHIKDLHDPGELKVSVYDSDLWTQDDFVGAFLFEEVFTSLSVSYTCLTFVSARLSALHGAVWKK